MFKFRPNEHQYVLCTNPASRYYGRMFVVAYKDAQNYKFWFGIRDVTVINPDLQDFLDGGCEPLVFQKWEVVEVLNNGCARYKKDAVTVDLVRAGTQLAILGRDIDNLYSIAAELTGKVYGFKTKDLKIEEVETGYSAKQKNKSRKSKSKKSK